MCQVSIATAAFGEPAPSTTARAVSRSCTFTSGRHELVDHPRAVPLRRLGAQLGVALGQERQLARPAEDVRDLDVVGVERGGRLEQELPGRVRCLPPLVVRVEEPVEQALELEVLEPVVVEEPLDVGERARLEDVLEVGVPEPDALEPGTRGLLAAVGEVEQAPLAPAVHLHRALTSSSRAPAARRRLFIDTEQV